MSLKPTFTIAVRSLVEHLLRSGDLHFDLFGGVSAADGIRAHQKVQNSRPENYQAEVPVRFSIENEEVSLTVTGRIDGVLTQSAGTVIEEIKSTRRSLEDLEQNPNAVHWGQARCYAYMWALQENLSSIVVRLTYVNLDKGGTIEFERSFDLDELTLFFEDLIGRYMAWMGQMAQWVQLRDRSIRQADFPFETYRAGQREMAVAVFRTIRQQGRLLVQAATGIGKTMAALFPTIKALGEKLAEKAVFLTARTTGRLAAESALGKMMENGLRVKSLTLTAKDKICFSPQSACSPDECECAKGYFDRINQALSEAFDHDAWTRENIEKIARQHCVCPFEFSLELANWADCIICDYNYAFAPGVMLQRLFEEGSGRHAVLVDEAHNLVDRSREMFSARLNKQTVLGLRRMVKGELAGVYRALGRINTWMAAARRKRIEAGRSSAESELPAEFVDRIREFLGLSEKWLALNLHASYRENLLEFFFEALRFVRIADGFDQRYKVIYEGNGKELSVKLFCLDPSYLLGQAWMRCRSAVLFSATLTPAGYFQSVLGCGEQTTMLNLPSPFPPDNLAVFVADRISTLYRERADSCRSVTGAISKLVGQRKGHYLLFFPSYAYLLMILEDFAGSVDGLEIIVQTPEMGEADRIRFLSRFKERTRQTLVGFAVMGGIFGEGIDLKGERLTGAVVVGVGLPGISLERNLIKDYYNRIGGCGFEFAYQYPGINRVLQAAGRVIRSEDDTGTILLIDRRYRHRRYRSLLPTHWRLQFIADDAALSDRIGPFREKGGP